MGSDPIMSCGMGLLANLAKALHLGSAANVCKLLRQAKGSGRD
jgi:hypothetical protein